MKTMVIQMTINNSLHALLTEKRLLQKRY